MPTMKVFLLLLGFGGLAHCARILAVLPIASKSHSIMHNAIFRLLAQRGHEVTVYSVFPPPYSVANLTYTLLPTAFTELESTWTFEQFKEMVDVDNVYGFSVKAIWDISSLACEDVFKDENIKALIESEQRFDLVFLEVTLGQESLAVFGHKFKAPIINFQGFTTWSLIDWIAGNSLSISHIPDVVSFPFTNKMSFKERLQNFVSTVLTLSFYHFEHLPRHQNIIQKYLKDPSIPHVNDMLKNIAITLTNSQRTLEYPRPYTPNIIPIAGAHMSSHMTPLPQNIQQFMDNAKEGVIFFSLGTFVPAHILPKEYIQAFVNAFKKIHQKVLWKIELESIHGLSKNVMLTKWVPQPTVLGHPNCVLFLTHGGLFSQHEAFYAGVPVVGIPFFNEQRYNMKYFEHLGAGVTLELNAITEETVHKTINTVIRDPRFKENARRVSTIVRDQPMSPADTAVYWVEYKENARRVSTIVRDQPMSPADTAVYWVEYVLRHAGAPHLKPASVYLRWYEMLMLDVVLVLILSIALFIYLVYYVIKRSLRFCLRNTVNVSNNKKRK